MSVQNLAYAALLAALACVLAACTTGSNPTLSPLALPSPSTMLSPVQTPALTPAPRTAEATNPAALLVPSEAPTTLPRCIPPDELPTYLGREACLRGVVIRTENWGADFVMWMAGEPQPIYVVVGSTFYLGAEGACLQVTGVVQEDEEGRIFIRADQPGQISPCER